MTPVDTLWLPRPREVRSVVLIAHGGQETGGRRPALLGPAALRMYPFAVDLWRAGRAHGVAVGQVRYRTRGWNGGGPDVDVERALDAALAGHENLPAVLVGHSMGARAALRAAGHPAVRAVAALAPWVPPGEPVDQLAGRRILLVHGMLDRTTDPAESRLYAARAASVASTIGLLEVARGDHGMIARAPTWQRLARGFALAILGLVAPPPQVTAAAELEGRPLRI
jgi:pimeloyl-ACP methyl ester carboxylesterase